MKPIEARLSFLASFFPETAPGSFLLLPSPIVGSYDQRSATSRALVRSPAMSCRASPWIRPSLPAGPRFPTSGRPRSPLGEVHEPQPAFQIPWLSDLAACLLLCLVACFPDVGAYVQWLALSRCFSVRTPAGTLLGLATRMI